MPDDPKQPGDSAYFWAWAVWCLLWTGSAALMGAALVVINFFAQVVPIYVAHYGYAGAIVVLMLALFGIACVGLYRRSRGLPAWEPWPIAKIAPVIEELLDRIEPTK
ncbi:MAG: hypothetical protein AAGA29_07705 [Planctomycetota bacterium]